VIGRAEPQRYLQRDSVFYRLAVKELKGDLARRLLVRLAGDWSEKDRSLVADLAVRYCGSTLKVSTGADPKSTSVSLQPGSEVHPARLMAVT